MVRYFNDSKLESYNQIKDSYYAKPDKTIAEHNTDLLKQKDILENLGYLCDKKMIELLEYSILFHDTGKANSEFQKRVKSEKKIKFNSEKEVPHNILSIYFPDNTKFEKEDYKSILYAVLNHHRFLDGDNVKILNNKENKAIIEYFLSEFTNKGIKIIKKIPPSVKFPELKKDSKNLKLLGLLMKCDYSASGGYPIEYLNDFLEEKLENLLNQFRNKDKSANWNDMQKFCKENTDKNIIVIADTGMGKTEGGLLWGGNNKIFFVLPIRTAINAMYERVKDLVTENITERVGLLHSSSLEYYLDKKNELVLTENDDKEMDVLEYNKRGKHLSLPLTISTPDQIFNFVLKYKGYEAKLATLSYSKIILDEIQMYDPNLLAAVIFGITKIIEMGGKVAIVTATFPPIVEYYLNKYLGKNEENIIHDLDKNNNVPETPIFIKKKFTNDGKIRHNIVCIDKLIDTEAIIWKFKKNREENKKSNKILVICNTIKKAQKIYSELENEAVLRGKINMLHSNFIGEDREIKETDILKFGETDLDNEGIWISTSLVEASLDIDFDYLFTELQDLSSLFQRFGRCNRRGKKPVDEANCFVYLKVEEKYLKKEYSKKGFKGFIDKKIYENSKTALENYCEKVISDEEIKDYRKMFESFSKKISEGDKVRLIEENLSFEKLKGSAFVDEFKNAYEEYEKTLLSDNNSQDDLLRDIQTVTVIPYNIYKKNEMDIDKYINIIDNKEETLEERQNAKSKLMKKTLSIQRYQLSNYIKALKNGDADFEKYKVLEINKFEKIIVIEADYDKELGFREKNFKDNKENLPTFEFI